MSELVKDIQNGELCNEDSNLANACIEAIRFYRAENRLEIVLKTDSILSMDSYLYFTDNVVQALHSSLDLVVHPANAAMDGNLVTKYLDYFHHHQKTVLASKPVLFHPETSSLEFLCKDEEECSRAKSSLELVHSFLERSGFIMHEITCSIKKSETSAIPTINLDFIP